MPTINLQQKTLNMKSSVINGCDDLKLSTIDIASNIKIVKNKYSPTKKNKSIKLRVISFFNIKRVKFVRTSEISHLIGKTIHPKTAETLINKIQFTGTGEIKHFKKKTITKKEYDLLFDDVIESLYEIPCLVKSSEISHLIDKTISPKIARKLINKIQFTGTGKIISFKEEFITKKEYGVLVDNVINPLSETPCVIKNRIRTPGEIMIDIASLIQTVSQSDKNKVEIENLIKFNWLEGAISYKSINNIIAGINSKIDKTPFLVDEINQIIRSLESKPFITKRNDNYYGRLFETELSKYIIDTPNFNMMKIRDDISSFIINDFTTMPYDKQKYLCELIADQMEKDTPAWRYNLSHANYFMYSKEPEKFIEMMFFTGQYSIPLVLSVAIKYIIKAKGMTSIMNDATKYYLNEINRQRNLIESISSDEQLISEIHGLLLPYQKNISSDYDAIVGLGIRPIDKYQRPIASTNLTEHDAIALSSERAIGIGMSGSANLLHFLFKELQLRDKNFPMDDAKLATAAWLNYSGGHSFNEAYSSFELMTKDHFKPISFNNISSTSELGENAVSHSYNKVLEASKRLKN